MRRNGQGALAAPTRGMRDLQESRRRRVEVVFPQGGSDSEWC